MTSKLHWGIPVSSETPITGVLHTSAPEFLYEDALKGVEPGFEEHLQECKNEYHDDCYFDDEPTYFVGFMKNDKEEYVLDKKAEYSAIVNPTYTQVLMSKYASRCELCSPCYPGQGDLDTPGEYLAYTLPPDVWSETKHLPIIELKAEPTWHQDTNTSPITGLDYKVWATMYKGFYAVVYPVGEKMGTNTDGWEYELCKEWPVIEYDSLFESYNDSGRHAANAEVAMQWAKNTIDEWEEP